MASTVDRSKIWKPGRPDDFQFTKDQDWTAWIRGSPIKSQEFTVTKYLLFGDINFIVL